ncbi:TPA: DedA family protein [Burkholderia multivorans]|uniref:YqaA family protein n=1 Tax=Burkholderia multivorans TaxID=87883 RepID=UPI000D00DFCA|nr:YqaA family protein [Burkholderia multivorans]MBU9297358.1 DedA family protein [Burkholderia multivorans]MBU9301383.1 DedA family protein [Burkholderia multivorans]MBU9404382.1 DedA family protein [Burkholderia multivorans]MBU9499233.1 DedA family protein [Burkholderia multivorans]MBU9505952.1 DedA family protein [Burkholderia multivorans]
MPELLTYGGLFAVSMLAATLFPLQSEAGLAGLLLAGREPVWALVLVASVGNVAGSTLNWALGRGIERFRERRWFPVKASALARAERWYARYGRWSLLLSWAPVIGDPLTMIAGVLREPLPSFLAIVTIAKVGRYLAIAWLVLH